MRTIRLPKGADPQVIADRLKSELALLYKGRYTGPMRTVTKHPGPDGSEIHGTGTHQSVHAPHGSGDGDGGRRMFSVNPDGTDRVDTVEPETPSQRYGLPELPEGQHWVLDDRLDQVEKKVAALGRRAARRGTDKYELRRLDKHATHTITDRLESGDTMETVYTFTAVEVTGEPPKVPGFRFVAVLQHLQDDEGNIVNIMRRVPGTEDTELPKKFRTAGPDCELCGKNIYRKDTFIVEKDGEFKQTGRDCLKDFTGHQDPLAAADAITIWTDLEDMMRDEDNWDIGGGGLRGYPSTASWLTVVAAVTRVHGYVSKDRAMERNLLSTKNLSQLIYDHPEDAKKYDVTITDADREKAAAVIAYYQEIDDESLDEFGWNMAQAVRQTYVMPKTEGISAYSVTAYDRAMGKEVERKRQATVSEWVGKPGDKVDMDLTVTGVWVYEGTYGPSYQYNFVDDDGNVVRWKKSKEPIEVTTGWEADDELVQSYIDRSQKEHDTTVAIREKRIAELAEVETEVERLSTEYAGVSDPVLGDWPGPDTVPEELRDRLIVPHLPEVPSAPTLIRQEAAHKKGDSYGDIGQVQGDEFIGETRIDQVDFDALRATMHEKYAAQRDERLQRIAERERRSAWVELSPESEAALDAYWGPRGAPDSYRTRDFVLGRALESIGLTKESMPVETVELPSGEKKPRPAWQDVVPAILDAEFDTWQAGVQARAETVKARQAVIADPLYQTYWTWHQQSRPLQEARRKVEGLQLVIARPIPEVWTRERALQAAQGDYEHKAVRPADVGDRIHIKAAPIASQKGSRPGNDTYQGIKQTNITRVRSENITYLGKVDAE